jgi:predicted SnoaL-like aldol condensation-catalyzing enzyme
MLPPDFTYEIGNVASEGDLVFLHGRYTNMGPTPTIAVDIFRVGERRAAISTSRHTSTVHLPARRTHDE